MAEELTRVLKRMQFRKTSRRTWPINKRDRAVRFILVGDVALSYARWRRLAQSSSMGWC